MKRERIYKEKGKKEEKYDGKERLRKEKELEKYRRKRMMIKRGERGKRKREEKEITEE